MVLEPDGFDLQAHKKPPCDMDMQMEEDSVLGPELIKVKKARLQDGIFITKSGRQEVSIEEAVQGMKIGEKLDFVWKPQSEERGKKSEAGSRDRCLLPQNATLQITVELMSRDTATNVTDDKRVTKKMLKEGVGFKCPDEGSIVKLKLIGKLMDGTIFLNKGHKAGEDLFEFKTDEEQVIHGLDKAVMKMKKGEVALVTISPEYAFGSTASYQDLAVVPSDSTVQYELELVSFENEKEFWELMNFQEKKYAAEKMKNEAEALSYEHKYARALKKAQKVLKFLEFDKSCSKEDIIAAKELRLACIGLEATCKMDLEYQTSL